MTKYELSSKAVKLYNELRDKGLSHSLALMAVVEYVLGSAAHVGASIDADKQDELAGDGGKPGGN